MARTQQVINEIRDLLHENLTDPNSERRNDDLPWVYTHQPNTSQLPTIQISEIDGNYDTLSIGNFTQFERSRIQVTVRVRTNNEYDYDTDYELETASDGLDYLVKEIVDTILDNHQTLEDNIGESLKSVLPDIESDIISIDGSNAIQKSIDFEVIIQR